MLYNIRKILSTSALALIVGFYPTNVSLAQGVVSLAETSKDNAKQNIPNEISLFGDESADVLTPSKSTRAVKSVVNTQNNTLKAPNTAPLAQTPQKKVESKESDSAKKPLPKNNMINANMQNKGSGNAIVTSDSKAQAKEAVPSGIKNIPSKVIPAPQKKQAEAQDLDAASKIDTSIISDVDDSVFNQMSNIEQETAILNLELKKEQVKNSIEALKAVQNKARQEELDKLEAKRKKDIEWRNEQKKKLLQEEQKLKNLEIVFEQERQEKILNAYKNKMLEEMQKIVEEKAEIYEEVAKLQDERKELVSTFKGRFVQLKNLANAANAEVIRVRDAYAKTISDLQTELSILKARLEASEKEENPFAAPQETTDEKIQLNLADLYAIMEIRGKGQNISAKLINKNGSPFLVQVGTTLQTGQVIDEITTTYVSAIKDGKKDYLYFSSGGIVDQEPIFNDALTQNSGFSENEQNEQQGSQNPVVSRGIPNFANEMIVR